MRLQHFILPALSVAAPLSGSCPGPQAPSNDSSTYDYIVAGSGPGGGPLAVNLARAGYSVLLVEAGDDQTEDLRTQILPLNDFGNPGVSWHYFVRHSDDEERTKRYNLLVWRLPNGEYWVGRDPSVDGYTNATRLGVFYPRGATLGGSAITNAAATFLPADSDWDYFDKGVGDGVWSAADMRRIFEKIEHNNYLPRGTPGHGFDGYLQTNLQPAASYEPAKIRFPIFQAGLKLLGLDPSKVLEYITSDANFLDANRDKTQGLWGLTFHADSNWRRYSPRDSIQQIRAVANEDGSQKYPLSLALNSLVTKVLFDQSGSKPKATGLEVLEGKSVYRADPRHTAANTGVKKQYYARKEVIISGGAFGSPQILQLSGIGPKALLEKVGVPVVVDSPGVGRNLQDNYELPVEGLSPMNITDTVDPNGPVCTYGAPNDPCVDLWRQGQGPYTQGTLNTNAMLIKTNHSIDDERDMFLFGTGNFVFSGFQPTTNQTFPPTPPTTFSWSTVKMHPQNTKGYVEIKSADPQDTPDINTNYFVEGGETDLGAILDTIAFARRAYATTESPVGPLAPSSPPCPNVLESGYCSDPSIDREWIQDQAFGHHPTGTNAVGPDSNPLAVLDTRLRVKGVDRLRVVDASAFPREPGAFPAVATFMLSEKATELVLEDAEKY